VRVRGGRGRRPIHMGRTRRGCGDALVGSRRSSLARPAAFRRSRAASRTRIERPGPYPGEAPDIDPLARRVLPTVHR
jgi:hypothetical protein